MFQEGAGPARYIRWGLAETKSAKSLADGDLKYRDIAVCSV